MIERESMIQFMNVITDEQKCSPSDMAKVLRLKTFCAQIDNLVKLMKDDPHVLQFTSQYVRGHKGQQESIHQIDSNDTDTNMASPDTKIGERYPKAEIRDQKSKAKIDMFFASQQAKSKLEK